MAIVKTYEQHDWLLKIYFHANGAGSTPTSWNDANVHVVAVATGFKIGPERQVNVRHGAGQATPKSVNPGNISYPWSFDNIFTNETVGVAGSKRTLEQLPERGKFAMRLEIEDGANDIVKIMTGCACESAQLTGSSGEGISISASGQAETYFDGT